MSTKLFQLKTAAIIGSASLIAVAILLFFLLHEDASSPSTQALEEPTPELAIEPKMESTEAITAELIESDVDFASLEEDDTDERTSIINPAALQRAEFFINMMEQAVQSGMADRWMQQSSPKNRVDRVVEALALRLNLTPEQRLAFEGILLENMNARQDPFRGDPELVTRLLQNHRDLVVESTALRIMKREGDLTEAQQKYGESVKAEFTSILGFDPEAHRSVPRWLENEDTLKSLDESLEADQQVELDSYIEDTLVREKEQVAFRKSNQLANQLGLSNEDRDSLYDFYYEKPDATQDHLKEILDSSVHPLLKSGNTRPGFGP